MNLRTLKASLLPHSDRKVRFVLPDGDPIPADFHVTEVGHVRKNFIDCGGTVRFLETVLLQTWVADNDKAHRLTAGTLAKILDLSMQVVPSEDLDVEVEYEGCAVAQYTIRAAGVEGDELRFALRHKKTDCLARELCGVGGPDGGGSECGETAGKCC